MRSLLPDDTTLMLVEQIYAAGCNPAEWPTFVNEVHKAVPHAAFSLHLHLDGTTLGEHCAYAGLSDEIVASYMEHYQFLNPYIPLFGRFRLGEVETLSNLMNPNEIKKHPFYHEWLRPAGDFTHAAGAKLLHDENRMLRMTMDIPGRLAELEQPAAALLRKLSPHLIRAYQLNEHFKAAALMRQGLEGVIDRIDGAAFLITRLGRVLAANEKAEALARKGLAVRIDRRQHLVFVEPSHAANFGLALAAIDGPSLQTLSATTFAISGVGVSHSVVHVLPLAPVPQMSLQADRLALVLVREAAGPSLTTASILRALYKLTKAEAEVGVRIASGMDTNAIADELSRSRTTIRNQLMAVMQKVGVSRQAELVAVVANLSPRLHPD